MKNKPCHIPEYQVYVVFGSMLHNNFVTNVNTIIGIIKGMMVIKQPPQPNITFPKRDSEKSSDSFRNLGHILEISHIYFPPFHYP